MKILISITTSNQIAEAMFCVNLSYQMTEPSIRSASLSQLAVADFTRSALIAPGK